MPFVYILAMAAFILHWQSSVIETITHTTYMMSYGAQSLKYLPSDLLWEFADINSDFLKTEKY